MAESGTERSAAGRARLRESFAESLRARRAALALPQDSDGPGRGAAARRKSDADLRARRGAPVEEERAPAPGEPLAVSGRAGDTAPAAEVRAAVRAVPVAISAARLCGSGPLALSFGRSLDVEIRVGAAGVEVALRPAPRLARAAEAELPALVAALRAQGIAVARAEVHARGGARGGRRPR